MFKQAGFPARHANISALNTSGPWSAWAETLGQASLVASRGGIIALIGGTGVGKTQIPVEVGRHITITLLRSALYCRCAEIFVAIRDSYRRDVKTSENDALTRFTRPHLLVIDELDLRAHSEAEDRALPLLLDIRYGECRPTMLLCNNASIESFRADVGEKIFDRIVETGGVKLCDWPSFRNERNKQRLMEV